MMAWMDEPALKDTLATGQTHFFSRSRRSHWHKGATSGHVQHVESIAIDCDGDVLLIKARQVGGACHEGYRSCFFRRVGDGGQLESWPVPSLTPIPSTGRPRDEAASQRGRETTSRDRSGVSKLSA